MPVAPIWFEKDPAAGSGTKYVGVDSAVSVVSATASTTSHAESVSPSRRVVHYEEDTLYVFYISSGDVKYVKTTDGGATFASAVTVMDDLADPWFDIWYERWANTAADPVVHIAAFNDSFATRGIYYTSLNLSTGVLSPPTLARAFGASPGNGRWVLAQSRDLTIYCGGRPTTSTGGGPGLAKKLVGESVFTNVNDTTPATFGETFNWLIGFPDYSSEDLADFLMLDFGPTTEQLWVRRFDASANDYVTLATIDNVSHTNGYNSAMNMAATLDPTDGHIKLVFWDEDTEDTGGPATLYAYDIFGATVTQKTSVISGTTTGRACAITLFPTYIQVWYSRCPDETSTDHAQVFGKRSYDGMVTWEAEEEWGARHEEQIISISYGIYSPLEVEEPTQYRLMLADTDNPDIPIYNITPLNVGKSGAMLTRFERGRERAVIGEPPRAGAFSTRVKNDSNALGYTGAPAAAWTLDEPTPGLAVRLNKTLDGGTTWTHMAQGNVDSIQHHFGADGFRSLIDLRANGPLSKLSGKKVTTRLYQNITTGTAIEEILIAAGVPDELRAISPGVVTLDWWWLSDADAMSAIVQLVNTEGLTADLFEAGDGKITFRDRNARYTDSRSATAQSTFTSEGNEPRFTGFDYTPGYREIVNEARATRYRLTVDPSPASTTVWEDGDGISYIVPPNGTLVIEASTTLPVSSAITPVSGTDYTVGLGSAVATLNRTSGSRFTITYTNSDGLGATLADLQLRASTQYIQHGPIEEVSGGLASVRVDVDDSVAAYGLRPWQGSMWSYIGHADMRDNLDVITTVKKDPRAWVRIGLNAEGGTARNTATAERELGDRIRIINSNPGVEFNEFCWIERIEHEVQAPEREITYYECTPITGALGTNPYDDITNGEGVDTSDEGGSATGTGSTGSSGSSSPSPIALYGFAAGNQLTTFNGIQRITGGDASNIANLIAAGADNAKILVDNGVSITLTSQLVLASFAKLYVPHGGAASISGGSLAGAAIYLNGATDVLIGGLNITSAPGDYTSNQNPASAIEITGASDRIQIVGTTITSPTFGGAVTDAPEGVNIWNNDGPAAAGPGSVTFYRVYWPVASAGNSTAKSKGVIAGGTTTATRNALTFYECVFSAWQRLPFVQDGAIADIVNCVYPNIDRIDAIEVADSGEARARASVFRNSTDGSHAWETRNLGGGYIAEGPEANDYQNSATFTEVTPAQVFTVPYSLTVNTASYVNSNVESNVGAGSVIIPE